MNNDIPNAKTILNNRNSDKEFNRYLNKFLSHIGDSLGKLAHKNHVIIRAPNVMVGDTKHPSWIFWQRAYPIIEKELTEKGYTVNPKKDPERIYISIKDDTNE